MAGAIFSGNINGICTALMMVAMLVFAVAWEAFTAHLDRKFEDNVAHKEMLTKVYKELMILGFIAFAVILCKELQLISWNAATLQCFEFCDLLVSICVLIYVGNTAISSFTMHVTQREWDRISMKPTVKVVDDVMHYLSSVKISFSKKCLHAVPFFATDWRDEADFKLLQLLFKYKFVLPNHFDYVMYIKAILEDNVVSMANITTYHWVLLMLLNVLWYVVMVYVMPTVPGLDLEPQSHPDICIAFCDNEGMNARRRRLASAPAPCTARLPGDVCDYNETGLAHAIDELRNISGRDEDVYWNQCQECVAAQEKADIEPSETMMYLALFAILGWLVVLLQSCVNYSISKRITHILELHDADDDHKVADLLTHLQEKLRNKLNNRLAMPDDFEDPEHDGQTKLIMGTVGELHHLRCIPRSGAADDPETDHVMLFMHSTPILTSNDVLSIRTSELLMFISQFNQLMIDFHFGLYIVHMQQRVPKAFEVDRLGGHVFARAVVHAAMVAPFFVMMYLLMINTRKISLLMGVLHLNDEAVSDVLEHMDMVKSIRRRIQETLRKTNFLRGKPKPKEAAEMLKRAEKGELAILTDLSHRDDLRTGRITRREMHTMLCSGELAENLFVTPNDLKEFLDRKAFAAYVLESKADQATAQTARTLVHGVDEEDDSIELMEFSSYLVRFIAEVIERALELKPKKSVVNSFKRRVTALDSVDDSALQHAHDLARCKHVFRATDADSSGLVSGHELRMALRRYKISITKEEFKHIFRVIDPDQSKSMTMDEWVDFMMATEQDLELQTTEAIEVQQQANAQKGDSLEVLVQEGAGVFFGHRAGQVLGGMVGGVTDVVEGTVGLVGKGLGMQNEPETPVNLMRGSTYTANTENPVHDDADTSSAPPNSDSSTANTVSDDASAAAANSVAVA